MKKTLCFLAFILFMFDGTAQVMEQDSLALVEIFNSTKGNHWFQKDYWVWGNWPVAEWFGVTVKDNRVIRLDLPHNNLSGNIPADIGNLDSLSFLDLSYDTILSLPESLKNLTSLDTLSLFATVIDTLPAAIGQLVDLKYFNFSFTQIRYLPEELGGLTRLELLLGSHGKLRNIPSSIGNLISLKVLDLQVNEITGLPDAIGNCTKLTQLWLNANKIPVIPSEIGNLRDLEYLILGGNNLIVLPDEIFTLTKLQYLNFAANDLKYISSEIGNLTNLKNFQFFKNNFTSIPDEIGNLTSLTYINGYSNRLSSLPVSLLNLPNIQTLFLANNALTFEDIEPLVSINGFEYDTQDSIGKRTDTIVPMNTTFHFECLTGGEFNQYQWLKNGDTIEGATNFYLELPALKFADSGEYRCVVTNTLATGLTLFSRPVRVKVVDPSLGYQGFPTSDGYWKVQFGNVTCLDIHFVNDLCSEYQYILDGDTLINSMIYHKFTCSGRDRNPVDETWTYWNSGYYGCYRNDLPNKRVYFIPNDSLHEILLYDFDLNLNDTLPYTYVYHPEEYNIITVDQMDSILIHDQYLRRYHLDNAGFGGEYLIEGIGSTLGLLTYITPFFEHHYDLLCFKNDAEGLAWYEYDSTACELITGIEESSSQRDDISIFPNPTADFMKLTCARPSNGSYTELSIYSLDGRKVRSMPLPATEMVIDVSKLEKGMYIVVLTGERNLRIMKFIKD